MGDYQLKEDLADRANLDEIGLNEKDRPTFRRSTLLEDALGVEVLTYSTGGYQGTMTFVLVCDGLLWVIKDAYGSCSHCDGLLAARRNARDGYGKDRTWDLEPIRDYAESMMNNAYAFDSANDAVRFVHEQAGDASYSWGWGSVADGTIENIDKIDYNE